MSTHHLFFNQIFSKIISGQDWKYEIAFIETESSQECWIFCWSVQISFQELTWASFSPKSTHQTWEFHLWTATNLTSKFGRLMNVFPRWEHRGPLGDSAIFGFPDPSFSPVVVLLGEDEEGNSAHIVLGQVLPLINTRWYYPPIINTRWYYPLIGRISF